MTIKIDGSNGIIYNDGSVENKSISSIQINPDFGASVIKKDTYPSGTYLYNNLITVIPISEAGWTITGNAGQPDAFNRFVVSSAGYYKIMASMGVVTTDTTLAKYISSVSFYINLNNERYEEFGNWDSATGTSGVAILHRNCSCIHYLPKNGYVQLLVKSNGFNFAEGISYLNSLSVHCIRPTS